MRNHELLEFIQEKVFLSRIDKVSEYLHDVFKRMISDLSVDQKKRIVQYSRRTERKSPLRIIEKIEQIRDSTTDQRAGLAAKLLGQRHFTVDDVKSVLTLVNDVVGFRIVCRYPDAARFMLLMVINNEKLELAQGIPDELVFSCYRWGGPSGRVSGPFPTQTLTMPVPVRERPGILRVPILRKASGYSSYHLLVASATDKATLGMVAEVQVRTALEDAWAEAEHELYASRRESKNRVEAHQIPSALSELLSHAEQQLDAMRRQHRGKNPGRRFTRCYEIRADRLSNVPQIRREKLGALLRSCYDTFAAWSFLCDVYDDKVPHAPPALPEDREVLRATIASAGHVKALEIAQAIHLGLLKRSQVDHIWVAEHELFDRALDLFNEMTQIPERELSSNLKLRQLYVDLMSEAAFLLGCAGADDYADFVYSKVEQADPTHFFAAWRKMLLLANDERWDESIELARMARRALGNDGSDLNDRYVQLPPVERVDSKMIYFEYRKANDMHEHGGSVEDFRETMRTGLQRTLDNVGKLREKILRCKELDGDSDKLTELHDAFCVSANDAVFLILQLDILPIDDNQTLVNGLIQDACLDSGGLNPARPMPELIDTVARVMAQRGEIDSAFEHSLRAIRMVETGEGSDLWTRGEIVDFARKLRDRWLEERGECTSGGQATQVATRKPVRG